MDLEQVENRLRDRFAEALELIVRGDSHKLEIIVVSSEFAGLGRVQKQQMVYECLQDWITSGVLHAVSIQTPTPAEWERMRMFV